MPYFLTFQICLHCNSLHLKNTPSITPFQKSTKSHMNTHINDITDFLFKFWELKWFRNRKTTSKAASCSMTWKRPRPSPWNHEFGLFNRRKSSFIKQFSARSILFQWPFHPIHLEIFPFSKKTLLATLVTKKTLTVSLYTKQQHWGWCVFLHSFPHQFLQLLFRGVGCCYRWPWRSTFFLAHFGSDRMGQPSKFAEHWFILVGNKMDWRA